MVPQTMLKVNDEPSLGQTRYVDTDCVVEIKINMQEDPLRGGEFNCILIFHTVCCVSFNIWFFRISPCLCITGTLLGL